MRTARASWAAPTITACLVFACPGAVSADNNTRVTLITHMEDSSSERQPLVTAVPKYPVVALRDRIEGEATVCYTIDARGRILRPAVKQSSDRMFAKSALGAIKQSSYEPLGTNKKGVVARACRTFRFLLDPVAIEEVE